MVDGIKAQLSERLKKLRCKKTLLSFQRNKSSLIDCLPSMPSCSLLVALIHPSIAWSLNFLRSREVAWHQQLQLQLLAWYKKEKLRFLATVVVAAASHGRRDRSVIPRWWSPSWDAQSADESAGLRRRRRREPPEGDADQEVLVHTWQLPVSRSGGWTRRDHW